MGYLIAENPLRDRPDTDEFIDIRLEARTQEDAIEYATQTARKYQLQYWELFQVVQITGCDLTNGDWD